MHIRMIARHCVLGGAIAACATPPGRAGMDDSTFVATMARLHVIDRNQELSDVARDSLRHRVLQEQGLVPADLERHARRYADDPARALAVWNAISRKTSSLAGDSAGAPPYDRR